jgi:hypothetical protein
MASNPSIAQLRRRLPRFLRDGLDELPPRPPLSLVSLCVSRKSPLANRPFSTGDESAQAPLQLVVTERFRDAPDDAVVVGEISSPPSCAAGAQASALVV